MCIILEEGAVSVVMFDFAETMASSLSLYHIHSTVLHNCVDLGVNVECCIRLFCVDISSFVKLYIMCVVSFSTFHTCSKGIWPRH